MSSPFAIYPSLKNKVVFVTGGANGIGEDIVRAFTTNEAKVAFVDIMEHRGLELATDTGALFFKCDVTDIDSLKAAIAATHAALGPISVLVNNAANDDRIAIDDIDVKYWDWSQAINLRPLFFAAQTIRPQMRELGGGSIINLSSVAWHYGADTMVPYVTAKSAIIGLTHSLARGFGVDNTRVNAIERGAVMTAKQRQLWYKTQDAVDAIVSRQMLKHVLIGECIAGMVLFLAADDSRMITKRLIRVDAGLA